MNDIISVLSTNTAKKVTKGWGNELWLVAEGAPFGFKMISIDAGRRTSLQYHERKEEANLLLRGSAILWYADSLGDEVRKRDFHEGEVVHVRPGAVHRIEAVTDIVLVEVSTPELDDVIRVSDDFDRGNGRIEAEHQEGR
ncbi:MAG: cupin domain-containing protein [Kibdelosporangium sp.]